MSKFILSALAALFLYLFFWPVPVEPVSWQAPESAGYVGEFVLNHKLEAIELMPVSVDGPEDLAIDAAGRVYASTLGGGIYRYAPESKEVELWVNTGGRPLGIEFDNQGYLIVADAYIGLLKIDVHGQQSVLTDRVGDETLHYVNDVDIADNGLIYFSDSSKKFGAKANGGTFPASLLDILEHGGHGRLLVFDPVSAETRVLAEGLNYANGVAVSFDQRSVLINETGHYRIMRYWLSGVKAGQLTPVIENLPGFPDNLSRGLEGKYWLGLVSPRSPALDVLSGYPFLRKVVQRLPQAMRPQARRHAHVLALAEDGHVISSLQKPGGPFAFTTGVVETPDFLYISSLKEQTFGRLPKSALR